MEAAYGPGRVLLGKYRIESVLGRGGMGVVLKVTHLQLGEQLALKVLSPEGVATPELHARFLREAQAVVRLRGEHVARISDVGVLPDSVPYIVMEYLRGLDLAGELERRGRLLPGEAVDYVLQACEALAEAHANGLVHRDIKPANLFLTRRPDGTPLVKVLDFGISKAPVGQAARLTKTDTVMGTSGYMSPEQMKASRDVDSRTDIWALGVVLYESLTGRRPFGGESFLAVALMAGTEPPPPMEPWVPRPLQAVVLRCLEKDRNDRFPSIAALAAALAPFARDQRTAAVVVDRTELLRQGVHQGVELAARAGQSPTATTLSGSARALLARSHRRRTVAGVIALLGSITLLSLAGLLVTGRWKVSSEPSYAQPESHDREAPEANHAAAPSGTANAEGQAAPPPTPLAAAPPAAAPAVAAPAASVTAVLDTGDPKTRKLAQCADFMARKLWQDLFDCATVLDALGLKDKAKEFHARATQETANEVTDGKVRLAFREGSLTRAQVLLKGLGQDSVYYKSLIDLFDALDNTQVEVARRRSQTLLSAHDCTGLRRHLSTQSTGPAATERSIAVIKDAIARCTAKGTPEPGASKAASAKARAAGTGEQSWNTDSPFAPVPTPSPAPAKPSCDTLNVDDAMQQAVTQYGNNMASAALALMVKALNCRQTLRMYQLAAMYACGARDLQSAKVYHAKLQPLMQAGIEQRCQQEGLDIRGP